MQKIDCSKSLSSGNNRRFEIDTEGFKKQMMEMKPFRIVQEVIANSFDEDSVTKINCEIKSIKPKLIQVTIEDDGDGFVDKSEAYTLYASSKKRNDPTKRGRFNLGEKQFLALAKFGYIETGTTRLEFENDTRKELEIAKRKGTKVYGEIEWNNSQVSEITRTLEKLMVPQGKTLTINDNLVPTRDPLKTIRKVSMPTTLLGENDVMSRVDRNTDIILYVVQDGEKPWLYELGIPVQKLDMGILWNIDIQQKIPMAPTRTSVSESYLKKLHAHLVNNAYDLIPEEESANKFVTNGLCDATKQAFDQIMLKRYGTTNIAVESTTDYRANEKALESGAVFLRDGDLDRMTRRHGEELGSVYYASTKYESRFGAGSGEPVEENERTDFVRKVTKSVAMDVLQKEIDVSFANEKDAIDTSIYGDGMLTFNIAKIGLGELCQFTPRVVGILIYQLAHDLKGNNDGHAHLSMDYINELRRIAGIVGHSGINHWIADFAEMMVRQ